MKLQIAFDMTDLEKALDVASRVAEHADVLEVGTLLIYQHGVNAVQKFKEQFPAKIILADTKIIDRGKPAVTLMANAGADWISVMAGTSNTVIHSACVTANDLKKQVMLDLLDANSMGQSALESSNLGASTLLLHQPYDAENPLDFLDKWEMVKGNTSLPIFVSAKINRENVNEVIKVKPDGIVVGKSITHADNPAEEAQFFHDLCSQH